MHNKAVTSVSHNACTIAYTRIEHAHQHLSDGQMNNKYFNSHCASAYQTPIFVVHHSHQVLVARVLAL